MMRAIGLFLASLVAVSGLVITACGDTNDNHAASADTTHAVAAPHADAAELSLHTAAKHGETQSAKAAEFHDGMRKLWEDHVTWTRLFIVSDVAGLPDLQATTDRLLQNQADIGDAIKPYYGGPAGQQLTALLSEHITTAAALLEAAKAGDADEVASATAAWYDNADRIAAFLHSANPDQWALSEMQSMMHEHLDLTLEEATAHLTGDYAADVAAYDSIHEQILQMADMLSAGIVAQFPNRF